MKQHRILWMIPAKFYHHNRQKTNGLQVINFSSFSASLAGSNWHLPVKAGLQLTGGQRLIIIYAYQIESK